VKKITKEVLKAIESFVCKEQSFISLDIYCQLGVRIEDESYPIHQQVRDAFISGIMTNYLSEWTTLSLESGGYANIWRYYLPKVEVKVYPLGKRADGRIELTKEILGHFPLLESELGLFVEDGKLTLKLEIDKADQVIKSLEKRLRINKTLLQKANLFNQKLLFAKVYPNRIEIMET